MKELNLEGLSAWPRVTQLISGRAETISGLLMLGFKTLSTTHHTEINLQMTVKGIKERCEVSRYHNRRLCY